jgi:hypothetical protein
MARIDLVLRIILADPPSGVVFSLQDKTNAPVDAVLAGAGDLAFDIPITLTQTPDGLRPAERFRARRWAGAFRLCRLGPSRRRDRALVAAGQDLSNDLPDDLALATAQAGDRLEARIAGRARDGGRPARPFRCCEAGPASDPPRRSDPDEIQEHRRAVAQLLFLVARGDVVGRRGVAVGGFARRSGSSDRPAPARSSTRHSRPSRWRSAGRAGLQHPRQLGDDRRLDQAALVVPRLVPGVGEHDEHPVRQASGSQPTTSRASPSWMRTFLSACSST